MTEISIRVDKTLTGVGAAVLGVGEVDAVVDKMYEAVDEVCKNKQI